MFSVLKDHVVQLNQANDGIDAHYAPLAQQFQHGYDETISALSNIANSYDNAVVVAVHDQVHGKLTHKPVYSVTFSVSCIVVAVQ